MNQELLKQLREKHKQYMLITADNYKYRHGDQGHIIHWDDANEVFYAIRNNETAYLDREPAEVVVVPYSTIEGFVIKTDLDKLKTDYLDPLGVKAEDKEKILKDLK